MKHVFHFSRRLNNSDVRYFFLGLRNDCNVAMTMVTVLEREISSENLVDEFERYDEEVPRFGDYMRQAPLNIAPPVWMPLPEDERKPEYYVREISMPPAAGWHDILAEVDAIQSEPFHPKRAPWQVAVVNGAPGGRAVLVMKAHHALSDGMAFAILFAKAFAGDVLAAPIEAVTEPPPRGPRLWVALRDRWEALWSWLTFAVRSLPEMVDEDRRRRERESVRQWMRPPLRWPLKSYTRARRLTCFRVPAAVWQAEAEARGGGPNELYLALVARIMRKIFGSVDFDSEPLRVAMPISQRGGRGVQDGRNAAVASVVELAGGADELADLTMVREQATVAKKATAASRRTLFEATLELLPAPLRSAIEFREAASCDVVATNVPIPMKGKILGIPIEMLCMVSPAIGHAVSFSLTTYGDYVYLAGNADLGIVPGPIDGCIEETLVGVFGDRFESFGGGDLRVR